MLLKSVVSNDEKEVIGYNHWCPGCESHHFIPIKRYRKGGNPVWSFNGDFEKPTFNPSVRVFLPKITWEDGEVEPEKTLCHYFIRNGVIDFCSDSPHQYGGKSVPLADIEGVRQMSGLKLSSKPKEEPKGEPKSQADESAKQAEAAPEPEPEVVDSVVAASNVVARYSSHPIQNYSMGDHKFVNGLLELKSEEEVAEFEKLLAAQPRSEQARIKRLDIAAAEKQVQEFLAMQAKPTQTIDSSVGERGPQNPVGKGVLGE